MLKILHLADLHLGWEPSYLEGEKKSIRIKERNNILTKAVDYALNYSNDISMVIIAGDLFEDYAPDSALIKYVTGELNRLTNAGIFLVTVPGNHDEITYSDSVYRQEKDNWPGLLVTNPMPELVTTKEIKGVNINLYSLAYTGGLTVPGRISSFPRSNLPGLHIAAFHGSLDWEGLADRSLPVSSSLLSDAGYDYVAMGHYHNFSDKRVDGCTIIYAGSPEFKNFGDNGTGHLTVTTLREGDVIIEKKEIAVRTNQILNVDLSPYEDLDSLINACRLFADSESMTLFRFRGNPVFPVKISEIYESLEKYFFYLEIEDESYYFSKEFLKNISGEMTIRGSFARRLKEREKAGMVERDKKVLKQALLLGLNALKGSDKTDG